MKTRNDLIAIVSGLIMAVVGAIIGIRFMFVADPETVQWYELGVHLLIAVGGIVTAMDMITLLLEELTGKHLFHWHDELP